MRGKLRFWLCAFILFAIGIMNAYGQNRTVSGTITDSKNVPIAGVSVFIPGTTRYRCKK